MTNWKDSLLVGVSQIDNQHRRIIDALDRLLEVCKDDEKRSSIGKSLNSAIMQIKEHLRDEENLLEKYAYPGVNAHKRVHAQFIFSMNNFLQEFERIGPSAGLGGKIEKTLVDWLIDHISSEDKPVGEHIQSVLFCK